MGQNDSVLEMAANLRAQGQPFALVTVVRCESPTSAKPGDKAVVGPDGVIHGWIGGGCAQPVVTKMACRALAEERPFLIRISPDQEPGSEEGIVGMGMVCYSGGTLDIFIDPINPEPDLLVIGATPAAQTLCELASRVGFAVSAAFPGATQEMFPDAQRVIDGLTLDEIKISPAFVVIATQGKKDQEGLEAALATNAGYISFIASARKAAKLKQYLRERGYDPARVDAIAAPAGVEINAVTPREIALSVLAALVRERRTAGVRHGQATQTAAPQAIDPVCAMTVNISGAEYTSQYNGQAYYFCSAQCLQSFEKSADTYLEAQASR
jgi:xanthine dehydrogenase accessory factor